MAPLPTGAQAVGMWVAGVQAVGVQVAGVQADMVDGTVGGLLERGTLVGADMAAAGTLAAGTWNRLPIRQSRHKTTKMSQMSMV